jgi:predicted ATPase
LAPAREVAEIAAALGRSFSHELICAVALIPRNRVEDALAQLVRAELIFQHGTPPDAEYTFKHALVQDAAYSTLLRGRRQHLHERIAIILETQFPDIVEARPEQLAHHFSQGGFKHKAITYWTVAGERAVTHDANKEAIRHFRQALELLQGPPETSERRKAELKILAKLGPALAAVVGFGAPEVETTYSRARRLCEQLGEPVELFQSLWGLWLNTVGRDRLEAARPLADELFAVARRSGDQALLLEACHAMSPTTLWVGEPESALRAGEDGMRLYNREQHGSLAFLYGGHDLGVCAAACIQEWPFGF